MTESTVRGIVATHRLGITGTDTGIGKTLVACALAARARERSWRVAAMKPVESGIAERAGDDAVHPPSDAERLRAACGSVAPLSVVRPYVLEEPLAPMIAAQRAHVTIDLDVLDSARASLEAEIDLLLVEGAGGLLVPITSSLSYLDLFARWRCELVVVAGNRLGVLNHVLLTVRAAMQAQVPVRAVVLNDMSAREASVAEATNFDALMQLLPSTPVFRFPWLHDHDDRRALAAAVADSGLDALLPSMNHSPRPSLLSAR